MVISPNSKQVYISYYDSFERKRYFALYLKDSQTDRLTLANDHLLQIDYGASIGFPSSICMSPKGDAIYMTGTGQTVIKRDTTTGSLNISQHFDNNIGGTDRLYDPSSTAVSHDGRYLYVAAHDEHDAITTFTRNADNGTLKFATFDSLNNFDDMVMAPDGRHLYTSDYHYRPNNRSHTIQAFALNSQNGSLQAIQTIGAPLKFNKLTRRMTFSPDGKFLYVQNDTTILIYNRNKDTGLLTFSEEFSITQYGLHGTHAGTVSPDNRHFYTNSSSAGGFCKIALFQIEPDSGRLTYANHYTIGSFAPQTAIRVSPDDRHVYAATRDLSEDDEYGQAALSSFKRNIATGELTLLENLTISNVYDEISDFELSDDGLKLYAVMGSFTHSDGALAIFDRDPVTGKLTLDEQTELWDDGRYSMNSPRDLTLSPDGRFLYIADGAGVLTLTSGHDITTSVRTTETPTSPIPQAFSLQQSYPNPFSARSTTLDVNPPATTIRYEVPVTAGKRSVAVELSIYNLQGQLVQTLVNKAQTAGNHSAQWDGRNLHGRLVSSGMYFYRLQAGSKVETKRLMVVR